MKEIIEIIKSLEDSGLLFNEVSETIQNEAKEQRGVFLCMYTRCYFNSKYFNKQMNK